MKPVRRAVIDVGTNSVKLLVADVEGRRVEPILEDSHQTRLGAGFYRTGQLQPGAIAQTAEAVARFAQTARDREAQTVRVVATSAAREAHNPEQLTSAIERACGLRVEIISGEQEAEWVFQGVVTDPALADLPLLLLDVGGGSAEFVVGREGRAQIRASFALGTVRCLEASPPSDPPRPEELAECRRGLRDFIRREVQPKLGVAPVSDSATDSAAERPELVGTGGTTSILARMEKQLTDYDRRQIEATRLSASRLHWHVDRLWSLPLEERKKLVGLPANRADVILMGAAIYEAIMDQFAFAELRISTRGLRFAALLEPPGS
jgi:exopolyphosphatase/guanosine-5'-triphosphate,3'-diphosphate pyrophosphatase